MGSPESTAWSRATDGKLKDPYEDNRLTPYDTLLTGLGPKALKPFTYTTGKHPVRVAGQEGPIKTKKERAPDLLPHREPCDGFLIPPVEPPFPARRGRAPSEGLFMKRDELLRKRKCACSLQKRWR